MKICLLTAAYTVALLLAQSVAQAQAPSAQSMIEQLKTKPIASADAPRTRGLNHTRNLSVDAATAQEVVATERASLSLQIQFDFNSAHIKPESGQALTNLATALQSKELLDAKFAIEGHTDAKGGAEYNQRLSQQRANSVREFLVGKGVEITRLSAAGKGASDLANKQDPLAAENRRVKIVNLQ
ncbi:MAG: OmpA family protein [Cytophagales bacterium]|nr:OmpA family protein [Cytophagales bacterium]